MLKVIIAGSRGFDGNPKEYYPRIDKIIRRHEEVEIVSGTARGADKWGETYALSKGHKIKKFPAEWDLYGKSAGYLRNKAMAEYADALILFWDGESRGSKHMLDIATDMKLKIKVFKY